MEEKPTKTKKAKVWTSIVLGVVLVVAGAFSVFNSEPVNNMFMQAGAEQAAAGVIELYPGTEHAIGVTADTMDAAIQARNASPRHLAVLITEELKKVGVEGNMIEPIVEMVITQLNQAYEKSPTEEIYLVKAQCVADGLRAAVPAKE